MWRKGENSGTKILAIDVDPAIGLVTALGVDEKRTLKEKDRSNQNGALPCFGSFCSRTVF